MTTLNTHPLNNTSAPPYKNPNQLYMVFDYETYSELDLTKVGSWEYSKHPSTEILCVAWVVATLQQLKDKTYKKHLWCPNTYGAFKCPDSIEDFTTVLVDPSIIKVAHNAFFEQVITKNVLPRYTPNALVPVMQPNQFICTAAMAAAVSLPRKLEEVCIVLQTKAQKNMEGNRLMKKWMKPRKPTKLNPSTRHNDRLEFKKICKYAVDDVDAEVEVFTTLPKLSMKEHKVWQLDQAINMRGVKVDRSLCEKTLCLIQAETKQLNRRVKQLTDGEVNTANQRDELLKFLRTRGHTLPDLTAKTVEDYLADDEMLEGDEVVKELLEIRQAISKTSTAKFKAFMQRSASDGFLRDVLLYHGASTGRWAGRGVQLQNLPRPTLKKQYEVDLAIEMIANMKNPSQATDVLSSLEMVFGISPMAIFSSILRGVIQAPQGKVIKSADFNAIEVRVLFWLANHVEGMEMYRQGQDIYKFMAMEIYKTTLEKVSDSMRFVGKQAILGAGYQAGHKKFQNMCAQFGVELELPVCKNAIDTYRRVHNPVVKMWSNMEKAAIRAVQKPGVGVKVHHVTWFKKGKFLFCQLPSGRRIAYFDPKLEPAKTPWGEKTFKLSYMGVCSLTRKWRKQTTYGGKLVENVCQAVARDVMAHSMMATEAKGYECVLSVHDELLTITPEGFGSVKELEDMMAIVPPWANGLPLKVEGYEAKRYRK